MNELTRGAIIAAAAFFAGAIPFGVIVSRLFFRRDIREQGSGNIGAANALRTLGKRGAAAVLLLDALKGAIPVLATNRLGGPAELAAVAAVAAVAGHCFSPFLGGRGGKGVATSYGAIWALAWPAGATFTIVWIAAIIGISYASVASMLASAVMPLALWFVIGAPGLAYGIASALLIMYTHRENLGRLRAGTENPLPLLAKRSPTR
ncbi:MAG: glycerol-3-phosphate 1-O-acyltransferase PlsY [Candidatus Velthaea sp.]